MTRLLKLQDEIAMALVKAQVGQTVQVLVEGYGRNEGTLSGRLDNNLTVEFTADACPDGQLCHTYISRAPGRLCCWVKFRHMSDSGADCP
ncbi:MAG: TRAM domain-containing protein [Faecalibacterium prausnitzii]